MSNFKAEFKRKNVVPESAVLLNVPIRNLFVGVSVEHCTAVFESLFKSIIDPERVGAVVIKTVLGESIFSFTFPKPLLAILCGFQFDWESGTLSAVKNDWQQDHYAFVAAVDHASGPSG